MREIDLRLTSSLPIAAFLPALSRKLKALWRLFWRVAWAAMFTARSAIPENPRVHSQSRLDFDPPVSLRKRIFEEAGRVCDGEVECFGTHRFQRIDWHTDFTSGTKWTPGRLFPVYKIVDLASGGDVKVPWELSRCHQLIPPSKAYALSHDIKYARWIEKEILNWIDANPCPRSINWTCAMDVAIRAVNWLWALRLCGDYFNGRDSIASIRRTLFHHGKFIRDNLEKNSSGYSSNHYFADLVGLIYLGSYFKDTNSGIGWLKFGLAEIEKETAIQFLPSGVNYELATGYHRLVTEMLVSVVCLLQSGRIQIPALMRKTAEKAIDYIHHYTRQDGTAPQIGDADDGRLHILGHYFSWKRDDHRHLLALGHALFRRNEWAQPDESLYQDAAILLGDNSVFELAGVSGRSAHSRSFDDAGIHVFRNDGWTILIKTSNRGPHEQNGWHTHNDVLSFDLAANGSSFIVDPGVGEYSGNVSDRNSFRSTRSHNTVMVDEVEQNSFASGVAGLWSNNGEAIGVLESCETSDSFDELKAYHKGYLRLPNPLLHKRKFSLDKGRSTFTITDSFEGPGQNEIQWNFVLHPEVIADSSDGRTWILRRGRKAIRLEAPLSFELLPAFFSPSYKKKGPTTRLQAVTQATKVRDYSFVFSTTSQKA